VFLFFSLTFFGFRAEAISNDNPPLADSGIINLVSWNFEQGGKIPLAGKWKFYEQSWETNSSSYLWYNFPSYWNKQQKKDNSFVAAQNWVSLKLQVVLPKEEKIYALEWHEVMSAFEIWVNGKDLGGQGKIGKSVKEEIPYTTSKTIFFTSKPDTNEIVIKASNFNHRNGGFSNPLFIGTPEQIISYTSTKRVIDVFVICCLLVTCFLHLLLFFARQKDLSTIAFAALCLDTAIRSSVINSKILLEYLCLPYTVYRGIEYISAFFILPLYLHFVVSLFHIKRLSKLVRVVYVLTALLSATYLFLNNVQGTYTVNIDFIFIYLIAAITLYHLMVLSKNGNKHAILILIGSSLLILITIKDMLYINAYYSESYLWQLFFVLVVLSQSLILSSKIRETVMLEKNIRSNIYRMLYNNLGTSLSSLNLMSKVAEWSTQTKSENRYKIFEQMRVESNHVIKEMDDVLWTLDGSRNTGFDDLLSRVKIILERECSPESINWQLIDETHIDTTVFDFEVRGDFLSFIKAGVDNVIKHSKSKTILIKFSHFHDQIALSISDNGIGFEMDEVEKGNGFTQMEELSKKILGQFEIVSTLGIGTKVTLSILIP
jgi:signal transduction histidine kinase